MADHGSGHGHVNRKAYMIVFAVLAVLTALEVWVAQMGLDKKTMATSLVLMALTKAAIVGYFYMHLQHEMKSLKLMVVIPFFFPALYAFVLISEAWWRLGGGRFVQ